MTRLYTLATTAMLALIFAASASAQTTRTGSGPTTPPAGETKIALINTEQFGDSKTGITRYANANKTLEAEFQPAETEIKNMQARLQVIADDIKKMRSTSAVDPKSIQAKQADGEKLQAEIISKKEAGDAAYTKRYAILVSPISKDITAAIEQYAVQRGYTMILDISKLAPAVLAVSSTMDVTQSFIDEYNSKSPPIATPAPR